MNYKTQAYEPDRRKGIQSVQDDVFNRLLGMSRSDVPEFRGYYNWNYSLKNALDGSPLDLAVIFGYSLCMVENIYFRDPNGWSLSGSTIRFLCRHGAAVGIPFLVEKMHRLSKNF